MALFSLQMLKKLMELEIRFKGARPSFSMERRAKELIIARFSVKIRYNGVLYGI